VAPQVAVSSDPAIGAIRSSSLVRLSNAGRHMRIRQHVNPLRSDFLDISPKPLCLPAGRPVEVELGSAEAQFLIERAAEEPERSYVGVEIRRELVEQSNRRCQQLGLAQVQSIFANITVDLPRLFGAVGVSRFFINFPDPWFKQRQRKRRVVNEELILQLEQLLAGDGEIHVATDIFDIALDAMAALLVTCANLGASCATVASVPVRAGSATVKRQASRFGAWPMGVADSHPSLLGR
jgi:tRNA (guanine-N7-)-methyltransferase